MADYKESDPFYHTAAWKRLRQVALMRDGGMCQDCMDRMRAGIGVRGTPDNLRALCQECHEREHPEKRNKKKRKTLERIGAHGMRVIKV